ncbi:MAG: hypothetical protein M3463_21130 [Verrucomicrobiota bacterium]|nr:hypothetical protein [Verrucomicrobiota bacterium]
MNESDFENELRASPPAGPSQSLEVRIARELASGTRAPGAMPASTLWLDRLFSRVFPKFPQLGWALTGAAATIAAIAAWDSLPSLPIGRSPLAGAPPSRSEPALEPVEIRRELIAAEDAGLVFDEAQTPARLLRYSTMERHAWTDRATGARLEVEVPREDLFLMPVAMQ